MLILGVDPGYRSFGYCLVKVNGTPELITHGVVDMGSSKDWRAHLPKVAAILSPCKADVVAVEEIVWQGRRKGAIALAHLVGTVVGYTVGAMGAVVRLYQPRDVKQETARGTFPKDFSEHEKDALSLCRLYLNDTQRQIDTKLADTTKAPKRTTRRRTKARG